MFTENEYGIRCTTTWELYQNKHDLSNLNCLILLFVVLKGNCDMLKWVTAQIHCVVGIRTIIE